MEWDIPYYQHGNEQQKLEYSSTSGILWYFINIQLYQRYTS